MKLRTRQIAGALRTLGQLDFVVVKLADDDDHISALDGAESFPVRKVVKLHPIISRSIGERLRCGFDSRFTGYYGLSVEQQDRMFLLEQLPQYDIVWLHQLRTANVFGQWSWERSVMDLDDVPSTFLGTARQNKRRLKRRLREALRIHIAKKRERLLGKRFNILSVCSDSDRKYLGFENKTHVIPNGFDKPLVEPTRKVAEPPRIGFIGIFEYAPNSEGIRWFAEKCWPRIKKQVPDARLRLVGKCSDGPLKPSGDDIDDLGWVEDTAAEIATWSTMIVPLQTGAGTRVKIAEGFSRKCPIVSTSLGAFGYEAKDGQELLLADTAEDFANACIRLIRQPAEAAAMAERAWQQYLEKWTWDAIRPRILAAAEDCLRRGSSS